MAAGGIHSFVGTYGINYGRIADNLPPPEVVVRLLKLARIRNVKIYDAEHKVLDAFRGTGLNLVVAIPNEFLKDMAANPAKAMDWLTENVQPYYPSTRIVGITVGNEVLGGQDAGLAEALAAPSSTTLSVTPRRRAQDAPAGRHDRALHA